MARGSTSNCQGRYGLWVVVDDNMKVALITEILEYPQKRTLAVPFCGGEEHLIDQWLPDIVRAMDDHARHNGCVSVEIFGRPGWEKILKGYDYKKRYVVLEREIT
jgi:hypothetical protein